MSHGVKKPSGTLIQVDTATGREYQSDTLKCIHCQRTWVHRPGSGKIRGFCRNCNGPICSPECAETCVHFEQRLENLEAGRDELHTRIFSAGGFNLKTGGGILI